jgi:hypothetical protein
VSEVYEEFKLRIGGSGIEGQMIAATKDSALKPTLFLDYTLKE